MTAGVVAVTTHEKPRSDVSAAALAWNYADEQRDTDVCVFEK